MKAKKSCQQIFKLAVENKKVIKHFSTWKQKCFPRKIVFQCMVESNKLLKILNPGVEKEKVAEKSLNKRLKAKNCIRKPFFSWWKKNVIQSFKPRGWKQKSFWKKLKNSGWKQK